MASYTFEPSTPVDDRHPGAPPGHPGAIHASASFSGVRRVEEDARQGAVPIQQPQGGGAAAPYFHPSAPPPGGYPGLPPAHRGYRSLAEAARALAEASTVSLDGSMGGAGVEGGGGAPPMAGVPGSPSPSLLQQRLLQHQQQQQQMMQQQLQQHPSYPRPPDWRIHPLGPAAVPILVSDDVVSGTKRDGWMSPVRRFFCLLVTFDVLFTGLLWVITVIVTGRDIERALRQQVLEYTIHDSMFDCVVRYKKPLSVVLNISKSICRFSRWPVQRDF